eukprot:scaffold392469_cov34-Prasinocladus_malaysianus.AAC.1
MTVFSPANATKSIPCEVTHLIEWILQHIVRITCIDAVEGTGRGVSISCQPTAWKGRYAHEFGRTKATMALPTGSSETGTPPL